MRVNLTLLALLFPLSQMTDVVAQSRAVGWEWYGFDSDVSRHDAVAVSAGDRVTTVLTLDGRVFSRGQNTQGESSAIPLLPPGRRFTQVASNYVSVAIVDDGSIRQWGSYPPSNATYPLPILSGGVSAIKVTAGITFAAALLSDGTVVAWGQDHPIYMQLAIPALPANVTYVDIATGALHGYAKRSDGAWVSWGANNWGQRNTPVIPAGVAIAKVAARYQTTAALLSDGSIQVWGYVSSGVGNVPPPPQGLGYVDVSVGGSHCLGLLSDGSLVGWGDNAWGQLNVPPLPTGLSYVSFSAGRVHSVALRSDRKVVPFGHLGFEGDAMYVPKGQRLRTIKSSGFHCLVVTYGGDLLAAGLNQSGQCNVPLLPAGTTWVDCGAGAYFSVGLDSNGNLHAFGDNSAGQLNVPSLPASVTYTQIACGFGSVVALRSDGSAVTWGNTPIGPVVVPPLPPGLVYRAVGSGWDFALLIRSDGSLVLANAPWLPSPPPLPPGVEYVQASGGQGMASALRSDGKIEMWDQWGNWWQDHPPDGEHYVEIASRRLRTYARLSGGGVVPAGGSDGVPLLEPGTSFHAIDAGWDYLVVATVGSRSSYVVVGDGCDPTGEAARIISSDTPKLGESMTLRIDRMSANVGWMIFGWNRLQPGLDLGIVGMPGCVLGVNPDSTVPFVGTLGWGAIDVPVPHHLALLGATWFNQAVLLDAGANLLGAKLSVVAEAVVGG